MSFSISTYDPRLVNLYLDGVVADNFADGTFISLEYNAAVNTVRSGAKGDVTLIKVNDGSGQCTFKLKQTSQMHAILTADTLADNATAGGIPAGIFVIVQGSTPLAEAVFKVGKAAKREFMGSSDGKDEPVCEWNLVLANLRILS